MRDNVWDENMRKNMTCKYVHENEFVLAVHINV